MRRICSARDGYALFASIVLMAIVTVIAAGYLKNTRTFQDLVFLEGTKSFQEHAVLETSKKVRVDLATALDAYLIPNAQDLNTTVTVVPGDPATDINAWLQTAVVTLFNAKLEHLQRGQRIRLRCLYQDNDNGGGEPVREPCTKHRFRDPKVFELTLMQEDPHDHVLTTTVQEIQINRARLTNYAYIVSDAPDNLKLANLTFNSMVGLFFHDPTTATGLVFTATQSPGTVFNGTLITNLRDATQISTDPGAQYSFRKVKFNESISDILSLVRAQFNVSKTANSTINHVENGTTRKQQEMLDYCRTRYPVDPNNCSIQLLESAYELNGCNIKMREVVQWTYSGAIPESGVNTTTPGYNDIANIAEAPQVDNQVYYLSGAPYVREGATGGRRSTLCSNITLMGELGIIIQNSLVKQSAFKNSALFAGGPIYLSDVPGKAFILDNGTVNGIDLYTFKANKVNMADAQVSANLEVTIMPVDANFYVPTTFYDDNTPNGKIPVSLGTLKMKGLVSTAVPFATSQVWTAVGVIRLAGFKSLQMEQGAGYMEHPPPSLQQITLNSGLEQSLLNISNTKTSVSDAIAEFGSQ